MDMTDGVATIETEFATVTIELDERRIDHAERQMFNRRDESNGGWWEVVCEDAFEAMKSAGEL